MSTKFINYFIIWDDFDDLIKWNCSSNISHLNFIDEEILTLRTLLNIQSVTLCKKSYIRWKYFLMTFFQNINHQNKNIILLYFAFFSASIMKAWNILLIQSFWFLHKNMSIFILYKIFYIMLTKLWIINEVLWVKIY